jgi:hypothetical protein
MDDDDPTGGGGRWMIRGKHRKILFSRGSLQGPYLYIIDFAVYHSSSGHEFSHHRLKSLLVYLFTFLPPYSFFNGGTITATTFIAPKISTPTLSFLFLLLGGHSNRV